MMGNFKPTLVRIKSRENVAIPPTDRAFCVSVIVTL